jgi:RNA polymerase sigma-70 factor (ECF subfamily)
MLLNRTNEEWLSELNTDGVKQAEAIADLWDLLKHGCRYTVNRHSSELDRFELQQIEQFVEDCAQDALMSILKHISEFRGDSKFTTWAYKFAINITLTAMRRESWKNISLDQLLEQKSENSLALSEDEPGNNPDLLLHRKAIWEAIQSVIQNDLTEKQQQVIKLMVFDEVPMDLVCDHLGTNRNAVYKLLHDARRKLKQQIQAQGFGVAELMDLFSA